MAFDSPDQVTWATIVSALGGTAFGSIVTAIGHFFKSRASMSALVDRRIEMLIKGYESRIMDLQEEIAKLEAKVDALTIALDETRNRRGFGL